MSLDNDTTLYVNECHLTMIPYYMLMNVTSTMIPYYMLMNVTWQWYHDNDTILYVNEC